MSANLWPVQNAFAEPRYRVRRSLAHSTKQLKTPGNATLVAKSGHCSELLKAPVRTRRAVPRP